MTKTDSLDTKIPERGRKRGIDQTVRDSQTWVMTVLTVIH